MLEISFAVIAFFTSMFTAVVGIGGGLMLIALMPGFIPAPVIIPIHAVVQLVSNASRAGFAWQYIRWEYALSFLAGSILGVSVATSFLNSINLDYISLFIAIFILINVWAPWLFRSLEKLKGEFFSIGIVQTGLGMIGGATGPLANSSLIRKKLSKDEVVATTAMMMCVTHVCKIFAFAVLGVSLVYWWKLILLMSIAMILGSWVGTRFRREVNEKLFKKIMAVILTLLALRIIVITLG